MSVFRNRDPLANPEELIRQVHAYAAYRLGNGPDAEDATSEVFARALRYRRSYDRSKGEPLAWLIGIARRCVDDALANRRNQPAETAEIPDTGNIEDASLRRLTLQAAVAHLSDRDRELIALRYGGELTAAEIAGIMNAQTNAIEVALHRALGRLRRLLEAGEADIPPAAQQGRV
jgi:RNA polymerase sigma-70 factor (ECF subfamily)